MHLQVLAGVAVILFLFLFRQERKLPLSIGMRRVE